VAFTRKQRLLLAIVPRLTVLLLRTLGATWRYRDITAADAQGNDTPIGITIPGPTIFAFWHCALLASAHRFRDKNIAILISQSFDGELIARIVERLGFTAIRGSSTRGGASALRGMTQAYAANRICAFTADGPKGPARIAKSGPIQLAQITDAKWLGAFHAEPKSTWHLKSWDSFMIPKPFTTITFTWPPHTTPTLENLQQSLNQAVALSTRNP
jgi:lysophospholipid acyltransferase (LPLAT)-like uncharacterized protein